MQCPVKNVRDGVVTLNGVAASLVEGDFDFGANFRCVITIDKVQNSLARLLSVGDAPLASAGNQRRIIAHLSAHFSVTHSAIQNYCGAILNFRNLCDLGFGLVRIVTKENRGVVGINIRKGNDFFFLSSTGAGTLLFHEFFKTCDIDTEAAFTGH